ncbi:MAG: hypothetical protein ACYDGR_08235 [Candidatus Dormibacteria bacterium]
MDPTSGNPFDVDAPDHFEDVSSVLDVKIAALKLHRSQPFAHAGMFIRTFSEHFARVAADRGYPGLDHAEAFSRVFTGPGSRMRTDGLKVPA